MFESVNKSRVQVKHVNVTEARANFATILSDTAAHYIITKNNKPQRVIINFEDFKALQGLTDETEQAPEAAVFDEPSASDTDKSKRIKPAKAIKGIIAQQFELSQQQAVEPSFEDEDFSIDKIKALSPEEKLTYAAPITAAETAPLDVLEESPLEIAAFATEDAALTVEGDYFQNAEEPAGLEGAAAAPQEPVVADEPLAATEESPPADELVARTPEEEEYFRRYRKLYENHSQAPTVSEASWTMLPDPAPPRQSEAADTSAADEILRQQEEAYQQMRSELEAAAKAARAKAEEFIPPPAPEMSAPASTAEFRGWNDSFALSSGAIAPPIMESAPPPTASPVIDSAPADDGGSENLPSLQELLKELDKERLSGEEGEALDNKDIDDLISRITSD